MLSIWRQKEKYDDRLEAAKIMLEKGASLVCPTAVNTKCDGNHPVTPLVLAVQYQSNELMELFLQHGAEFCPLSLTRAVECHGEELVRRIINAGVDINTRKGIQ